MQILKTDAKDALEAAQVADDFGEVIFLEKADCGDSERPGIQARAGVVQGDAAEGENRDSSTACLTESFEAGGRRAGCAFLFEYGSEDCEVGFVRGGAGNLLRRMTGDSDDRFVSTAYAGGGARAT